jgi:MerR family transcriptional regulator, light-induced transcriptional regulator
MNSITQSHFLDYHNNLVDGNKDKCSEIVQSLLDEGTNLKDIYVELFQKSLYRIGKLWDHNELTIPEEHMATQITVALVSKFAPPSPVDAKYKSVVTCIDKEFHELGAKMVSHVFEMCGWKTYYLGASVPTKEIVKYAKRIDPDIIALSWSLYLNLGRFLELIDHLVKFFPHKKIVVGGQALNGNSDNILKKYPNTIYIPSIYELDEYLKKEYS